MISKITEPKVSITQSPIFYNKKWGFSENITLNGKAIATEGYVDLLGLQDDILTTYEIINGQLIVGGITRTNVFLQSIDFGSSDYLSNIDYTVVLLCYPNDYFIEQGIINPSDKWDFSEDREKVLTVSHVASAAGINTAGLDGTGFDTVQAFVKNLVYPVVTEVPTSLAAYLEGGVTSASAFVLISQSESINRINGEYSISEVYELDLLDPTKKSKISYSVIISEEVQGFHKASISGNITGGINTTPAELETILAGLDFKTIIEGSHGITLNETPITKTKKINTKAKSISFSFEYDDAVSNIGEDTLILELSLNESKGEDKITKYSLQGSLKGRSDLTDKWELIESNYDSKINIYKSENVFELFSNYYDIEDINKSYTSASFTKNKFKGEISFSVNVTNEEEPPEGFEKFDYSVGIQYPYFKAQPYALVGQVYLKEEGSEEYVLQNLEYFERAKLSINGTAVIKDDIDIEEGIKSTHDEILNISSDYLSGDEILITKTIGSNPNFGKKITFNYSWDYSKSPANQMGDLGSIILQ